MSTEKHENGDVGKENHDASSSSKSYKKTMKILKLDITSFGIFHEFKWDENIKGDKKGDKTFTKINVIYGSNYSGKTTLSRIFRHLETGKMPPHYENSSYRITWEGKHKFSTEEENICPNVPVRVFNEDFCRENLSFLKTNENDGSIKPFAILGKNNVEINKQIEEIVAVLGVNEIDNKTLLYKKRDEMEEKKEQLRSDSEGAKNELDGLMRKIATQDRGESIKYKHQLYGDQNYTVKKLCNDIAYVSNPEYVVPSPEEEQNYKTIVGEEKKQIINKLSMVESFYEKYCQQVKEIVSTPISDVVKIPEFIEDGKLNEWAREGKNLHNDNHENCLFCGNRISAHRWDVICRHFSEESEKQYKYIEELVTELERHKKTVDESTVGVESQFYSSQKTAVTAILYKLIEERKVYFQAIDDLISQLKEKQLKAFKSSSYRDPDYDPRSYDEFVGTYNELVDKANAITEEKGQGIERTQKALRLKKVYDFYNSDAYKNAVREQEQKNELYNAIQAEYEGLDSRISDLEKRKKALEDSLSDESSGAECVNQLLSSVISSPLRLVSAPSQDNGKGKFIVMRQDRPAYNLSEGESNLISLCYFLASLQDKDTSLAKYYPIIWIDDPICSLDANNLFLIYALLCTKIEDEKDSYSQIFISTHNSEFFNILQGLNYLKKNKPSWFIIKKSLNGSLLNLLPEYLEGRFSEYLYLFDKVREFSEKNSDGESSDGTTKFDYYYSFCNIARKFLEIYLHFKYPDAGNLHEAVGKFFGNEHKKCKVVYKVINVFSHVGPKNIIGHGPEDIAEIPIIAQLILDQIKNTDKSVYDALYGCIRKKTKTIDLA